MVASPQYPVPWSVAAHLLCAALVGSTRSFQADALSWARSLQQPIKLHGSEYLPGQGPAVLTVNHYYRPGYRAWWTALAVSSMVPAPIQWVMTATWTATHQPLGWLREAFFHRLFARIARVYDFITMPPMPPRPWEVSARAAAVRRVLHSARSAPGSLFGLAPEGGDNLAGTLVWPPAGVGRFVHLLAGLGLVLVPVGVYEDTDGLCVRFGRAYQLDMTFSSEKATRDGQIAAIVMAKIAALLPEQLRGCF
jgi:hypothetical protein